MLTDGSVLFAALAVDNDGNTTSLPEYKLTPDINGSYVNGTWTRIADLPAGYGPLYFAAAVLPDGRVIYEGGEYNGLNEDETLTDMGAIYDPVANKWTAIAPPPFFVNLWPTNPRNARYPQDVRNTLHPIGDSQSVVLPDGRFMVANKLSNKAAILDPKTLTWTETGSSTKNDWNSEEGWTLLPNGKVLAIDIYIDYWAGLINAYPLATGPGNSEIYDPQTGQWTSAGNTVVPLSSYPNGEIGTQILLPDGRVWAIGNKPSGSHTAFYDYKVNQWSAGPNLPVVSGSLLQGAADTGAVLLPNGNVLFRGTANGTAYFYEFDGQNYISEPPSNNVAAGVIGSVAFLMLPNGQALIADLNTNVEFYTPDAYKKPWYAPKISNAPHIVSPGGSYKLTGIMLNGISQASIEGDDWQDATNYPLVRITNKKTGHVFYSRTHDFSSMAVANPDPVSTMFDVPANQETGPSILEVVTNGIASDPVNIEVNAHFDAGQGNANGHNNNN